MSGTLTDSFTNAVQSLKLFLFGENNSRLEYLIENFYKLNHERRALIIFSSIAAFVALFILVIVLYISGLFSLQSKLSSAYSNTNSLRELKTPYGAIQTNFDQVVNNLRSSNSNFSLIPFIEQKAKDMSVQAGEFSAKPLVTKFTAPSPFADLFEKVSVDFKLTGISIKKTMEFIDSLEQSQNKIKVSKMRLISVTDAKLYFDVYLTVDIIMPISEK